MGSERFDDIKYLISNFLDIDSVEFSEHRYERDITVHAKIQSIASRINPKLKQAIVSTDEAVNAFANYYILQSDTFESPWEIGLFSNLTDAEKWAQK